MIVKVTVILALGFALSALARSAAVRHFVWALTLTAALALPAIERVVPELGVAVWSPLPGPPSVSIRRLDVERAAAVPTPPAWSTASGGFEAAGAAARTGLDARTLLLGLWSLGALLVAGSLAAGHLAIRRLVRRGKEITDPDWRGALARAAAALGLTKPVRLVEAGVGSPMVWGFGRPVILLPPGAKDWPADRRRAVLEHELAHVARHDIAFQSVAGLVCAAYWFHPLAWWASRRLRSESERACDDRVLSGGMPGAEYAAHLLEVARGSRRLRLAGLAAIGMARPTQLEGRLLAALDGSRPRFGFPAAARAWGWAALALLVPPLAALRPVPRAAPLPAAETPAVTVTNARTAMPTPAPQAPDSTIERAVEVPPGGTLILDFESGGSVDIQGWDEPRVLVRARLGGLSWRDTRVDIERVSQGVRVHARQAVKRESSSTNHHFEIRVPRRFDLRIISGGGSLTLADVEGTFRGQTGGGELTISHVSGWADLSTGGGDIEVSDSDLRGSVRTGGGRVILSRVPRELEGSSGSGPVMYRDVGGDRTGRLTVAGGRGRGEARAGEPGVLHLEKAGGDITLDEAEGGADVRTGGGRIRIGPASGMVRASTGGGDIEIGPVAGSVEAGTGAGDVSVVIVPAAGADQSVEISAGVGSVVLELPVGFSGRFDLETAYTENADRKTRIESDWDLEHDETSRWDDREGTPRKYVRARGSVGSGGGLVRVRTVNGDITVRRADR
jgi:beta-lactamase regulating signal transducer with metallopeptidase domain